MLKITPRQIDELHGYARNSRVHSDAQIEQLMASLAEFGWCKPVATDGNNGLVTGHGMVAAARRLRDAGTKIPNWPDADMVPTVDLAHLTKAQKRAYVIADNKLAMNSTFDTDMLRIELADLSDEGFDLDILGFSELEIESFLGDPVEGEGLPAWDGMPEYEHEDQTSAYKVVVHFANLTDLQDFARRMGQAVTEKTKSIWHPQAEIRRYVDKRYLSVGEIDLDAGGRDGES